MADRSPVPALTPADLNHRHIIMSVMPAGPDLPEAMNPITEDVLSSVLGTYQLRTHVFANPKLCGDWHLGDEAGSSDARFHLLAAGGCWLHLRESPPTRLFEGDLVILPRGGWHIFSASQDQPQSLMHLPVDRGPPHTSLVCGRFEFIAGAANPILGALPAVLIIPSAATAARGRRIAEMMAEELDDPQPGHGAVLDKLGDTLFVMSLRYHIQNTENPRGVVAALADSRLCKALIAIHQQPDRNWTVNELAQLAAMSRTRFAETFHLIVGLAPIDYLTRWRMTCAEHLLTDPHLSMDSVAEQLGYESVESFRRAFKRIHGRNPGAFKRFMNDRLNWPARN